MAQRHTLYSYGNYLVKIFAEVAIDKANVFPAKEFGHEGATQLQDLRCDPESGEQQLVLNEF
jgi:hypothetical protein